MKSYLKQRSTRDWLLFVVGISSGLRISDILKLTVEDVDGMDRICIRETKTGKGKDFPLSSNCRSAIKEYLDETKLSTGVLFPSRKGGRAITRQQAYAILNDAAVYAGVVTKTNGVKIGCHSTRKTFAYWAYTNGVALEKIQKIMNHSSSSITLAYIGISKQDIDDVYIELNL